MARHATLKVGLRMKLRRDFRPGCRAGCRCSVALVVIGVAFDLVTRSRLSATTGDRCARASTPTRCRCSRCARASWNRGPRSQYSYLVRSTAKYECPFFGPDGKLRRRRVQASELGTAFAYEVVGQRHLPADQRARRRRGPRSPTRCTGSTASPKAASASRTSCASCATSATTSSPGRSSLTRVAVDPLLDAAILKARPAADRPARTRSARARALRQGNAVERARLPAGRDAGGVERQGRQPLRPRSGAGLGPRRLRDRRAPVGGKLGQPGAGGVVPLARPGAGRRVPRRLQGPRRAERRRRDRSAGRVHAQEEAHPARARRRGIAGRARACRARARQGRARRRARCRCSTSAAWSCASRSTTTACCSTTSTGGSSRSTTGASPSSRTRRKDGGVRRARARMWVLGADRLARVAARRAWARTSATCWRAWSTRSASRCCTPLDYRHALANPSSADERRRGREVSRTIARDRR